jgi:hypothetical protein
VSVLAVPAVLRGELITGDELVVTGPAGRPAFTTPDPHVLAPRLGLRDPLLLRDVQALPLDEIVAFLAALGPRLDPATNPMIGAALAHADAWSDLPEPVLRSCYRQLPGLFEADAVRRVAERTVGAGYLDGWVSAGGAAVRAFGSRAVHVVAGNNPIIAAISVIRNAITRSDAVLKAPSNDPMTAAAIAATMAAVAPDHPLTRHLSAVYWRGGDEQVENLLYRPQLVEKIVAWGGFGAVRHVTRYLAPGLELITLDPKLSATVIGAQALADEPTMRRTARLAAVDVGALNQLGCFNARVIYLVSGTGAPGVELATRWGELLHRELQALPAAVSTPVPIDPQLRAALQAARGCPEFYRVIGGHADEGAVVVSLTDDPVEFQHSLAGRVANVVPVADPARAVRAMTSYTQTLGVYPDSLKRELRDLAPLYGVQRLVSLGYATRFRSDLPQDALEPARRMVRWIVDETYSPRRTHPHGHLVPESQLLTDGVPAPDPQPAGRP